VVADHGARGDGVTDDTVAIKLAIAAAASRGGVVYFPSGAYTVTDQLLLPCPPYGGSAPMGRSGGVTLLGAGPLASVLKWPTDLGQNRYAVAYDLTYGSDTWHRMLHLGLQGPGVDNGYGNHPCQMNGILAGHHFFGQDLYLRSFNAGIARHGDHMAFDEIYIEACYYGVYHAGGSEGDTLWQDINVNGAFMAGMGIAGGYLLNGEVFVRCGFTGAPYGIWGESGNANLMAEVVFYGGSFEGAGNAAIGCGNANRGLIDCTFQFTGLSWNDSNAVSGVARNAVIEIGGVVQNCSFIGSGTLNDVTGVGKAYIDATSISGCRWEEAAALIANLLSAGLPFAYQVSYADGTVQVGATRYALVQMQAPAALHSLAAFGAYTQAVPYGQDGCVVPYGVVSTPVAGANNAALLAIEGKAEVAVASGAAVTAHDLLKADAAEPVAAATAASTDHLIFGMATDDGAAGGTVPVWVRCQR
jgi:hypothetical protein